MKQAQAAILIMSISTKMIIVLGVWIVHNYMENAVHNYIQDAIFVGRLLFLGLALCIIARVVSNRVKLRMKAYLNRENIYATHSHRFAIPLIPILVLYAILIMYTGIFASYEPVMPSFFIILFIFMMFFTFMYYKDMFSYIFFDKEGLSNIISKGEVIFLAWDEIEEINIEYYDGRVPFHELNFFYLPSKFKDRKGKRIYKYRNIKIRLAERNNSMVKDLVQYVKEERVIGFASYKASFKDDW